MEEEVEGKEFEALSIRSILPFKMLGLRNVIIFQSNVFTDEDNI